MAMGEEENEDEGNVANLLVEVKGFSGLCRKRKKIVGGEFWVVKLFQGLLFHSIKLCVLEIVIYNLCDFVFWFLKVIRRMNMGLRFQASDFWIWVNEFLDLGL